MRGDVENARTVELFERGLGGLPSGKHSGLGQNRFERPRFACRPFQRWEIDSSQVEVRAGGLRKPGWKPDVSSPCPDSWKPNSPCAEQRGWKPDVLAPCRDYVHRGVVIGIGHNYRVLIVRPAHRRPEQVAPARQIADRVTFYQVAAPPINEGGERNEVEQAIGRYQQATGGAKLRLR